MDPEGASFTPTSISVVFQVRVSLEEVTFVLSLIDIFVVDILLLWFAFLAEEEEEILGIPRYYHIFTMFINLP